jgi:uncharacterized protein (TIGR00269 family)
MKCSKCRHKAVLLKPVLCKEHFITYFESKVVMTIKKFKLLKKKDRVAVAVSGGKDSMSCLSILHSLGYKVCALAIDEGISGYRESTLRTLTKFCTKNNVLLNIYSFKDCYGQTLDEVLGKDNSRPCTICGVLRRNLLNIKSKGYDVIATGHNMDDEAQAIIMNLLKGNIELLARLGPISGVKITKGFTKRVKPLYLCTEKEVMTYSYLKNLVTDFNECPYVHSAFRLKVRDSLNEIETQMPGIKKNVVSFFLEKKDSLSVIHKGGYYCSICKEPSSGKVCNSCRYLTYINNFLN